MNTLRAAMLLAVIVVILVALTAFGCARETPVAAGHFATPEAAVESFVAALRKHDSAKLRELLGPESDALLQSGDEVQAKRERTAFLSAFDEHHDLVGATPDIRTLEVGNSRWPLPIPIVKRDGGWQF